MAQPPDTVLNADPAETAAIRCALRHVTTVETPYGIYRPATFGDADAFFTLLADLRVSGALYTIPKPVTRDWVERWIKAHQQEAEQGAGLLMLARNTVNQPSWPDPIEYTKTGIAQTASSFDAVHILVLALPKRFTQCAAQNFTNRRFGQLIDDSNNFRRLEARKPFLGKGQQLLGLRIAARPQNDRCVYRLAPFLIGYGIYAALGDCLMLHQYVFDLSRINVKPAGNDHVFLTVGEIEISISGQPPEIAGAKPAIDETLFVKIGTLPKTRRRPWRADRYLSSFAWRDIFASVIPDSHLRLRNLTAD